MSPLARFYKLDEEKRASILDVAAEEFAASGFDAASLNQIIARSSISKGSFYYYFEDKLDLFGAVIRYYFDPDILIDWELLSSSSSAEEFWERLSESSHNSTELALAKPLSYQLGLTMAQLPPESLMTGSLGEYVSKMTGMLAQLLVHGQQLGAIRQDMPLELMLQLWSQIDQTFGGWILSRWKDATEQERDELIDMSLDTFRRLFSV